MLLRSPHRAAALRDREAEDADGHGDGARLGMVLAATGLAMFLVDLDFFALNLAIPKMAGELDVSATTMQWVISGYMLAGGAFLIPGGRLGDILGRRRMLIAGIVLFAGASGACALAPSPEVLIGFRVIQGMGCSILFPVTIAVVTNAFPEDRRKRAIGNLYGVAAVATAMGPFVGGAVTSAFGWRWVFVINVPLGLIALALAMRSVRESRDETVPRHIDLPGLAAVVLGIAAVTFAVDRGEEWGWASAATLGTFAAGVALLCAFLAIERRVRWPLVDLSLFRNVPYVKVTLLGMVGNICLVVTTFASTLYLQRVQGYSPLASGAIFLAASGMLALSGPLSGRLAERFDVPRLMAVVIAIGAVGLLGVAAGPSLGIYIGALVAVGIGYGLAWSLTSVGTQTVVPTKVAGEASGVTLAIVVGVAGLCVAISAAVIDVLVNDGAGRGDAIGEVLRVAALASVVAAVAITVVRGRGRAGAR